MDNFIKKIDKLIRSVISCAVPSNESFKTSDFPDSVKAVQNKIIDIFRYSSFQFLPPFLDKILITLTKNSYSQDKKTRFSTAICITALINLFPNDENVYYYQPIIEKLLEPGYRPMIDIGVLVLDRFARISGPNRDRFLTHLILSCRVISNHSTSTEIKYTAAVIWKELSHSYPEGFYHMKKTFVNDFFKVIENEKNEQIIYYLLINTITELFRSEAASVGVNFLENLHESLLEKSIEIFSNGNVEKMPIIFDLLLVILEIPPYIDKSKADLIYPKLIEGINSKQVDVVSDSVDIILILLKNGLIRVSDKLIQELFDKLIVHLMDNYIMIEPILIKLFNYISDSEDLYEKIKLIHQNLPKKDAPLYSSNLIIAALSLRKIIQPDRFFDLFIEYNIESKVPLNFHSLLKVLNTVYDKNWANDYSKLKNVIISSIRQELSKTIFLSDPTDRLIASLKAL